MKNKKVQLSDNDQNWHCFWRPALGYCLKKEDEENTMLD